MFPYLPAPNSKEAARQMLAELYDKHLDSGGAIRVCAGFRPEPLPKRSAKLDPDTILKRKSMHKEDPRVMQAVRRMPISSPAVISRYLRREHGLKILAGEVDRIAALNGFILERDD